MAKVKHGGTLSNGMNSKMVKISGQRESKHDCNIKIKSKTQTKLCINGVDITGYTC